MKASIILTTYNRSHLIKRALDSCLSQKYRHKEIIVVNDGTDDGGKTYNLLYDYLRKYDNITYIDHKNKKLSTARNVGIRQSTGELITCFDDDDLFFDEDSLQKRAYCFCGEKNPTAWIDVLYTSARDVNMNGDLMKDVIAEPPNKERMLQSDYIYMPTMMWRRSVHDKIGYFNSCYRYNEDWDWKIRCLWETKVGMLQDITLRYTRHGDQNSFADRPSGDLERELILKLAREKYLGAK